MDRLKREANPPVGQLASPKPQYKDVQTNDWEELKGEGGASYVKDKDALAKLEQARLLLASIDGKDFATDAKLGDLQTLLGSLDGKDFATQTTLAQVKTELDLVKTELETIKANQTSGDQKVQLSGTKVLKLQTHARQIRKSEAFQNFRDVPSGAKGVIFHLSIHGVVGTFTDEQGIRIRLRLATPSGSPTAAIATTYTTMSNRGHKIIVYPGVTTADNISVTGSQLVVASLIPTGQYSLTIEIAGTFGDGQGIDCEVVEEWLF